MPTPAATAYMPVPTYVGTMPSRFDRDYDYRAALGAAPAGRAPSAYYAYDLNDDAEANYLPQLYRSGRTTVPHGRELVAEGEEYEYPQWARDADRAAGIVQSARFRSHSPPRIHFGRAGGGWRHITQCTGQKGENILFLDGAVKVDDCRRFPPYGWSQEPRRRLLQRQRNGYRSQFNERAKEGFKYWYEEPKQPKAARTIQGRQLVYGSI